MKVEIGFSVVFKVIGWLLLLESAMMLAPLVVELFSGCRDWQGLAAATVGAGICGGALSYFFRYTEVKIYRREGFMLVTLAWIFFSLFGMIPFMMSSSPLGITDAFFETMSGFTTTGASVITNVEGLGKGVLLWRAMTQWIGGLGIILFLLALLPSLNEKGGIPMFNAEVTGITHDKIHPRIRQTAASLWTVYLVITIIITLMLWAGPMDFFDSLCHALTTISTGGFSTKNAGVGYWQSNYVWLVLTFFMLIGGINFSLIYASGRGRLRTLFHNDVMKAYFLIVAVAYLLFLGNLLLKGEAHGFTDAFVEPMFHIFAAITSTGFSLVEFSDWGPFALAITMLLMMSGACAGSTSGGIKIDRLVALRHNLNNMIKQALYPRRVFIVRVNGKPVPPAELSKVTAFVTIYIFLAIGGAIVGTAYGISLDDAFFVAVSCIGNNGLGYGITGSSGGFHLLPDVVKWTCSLLMLIGRLELFSVLVMLTPLFWKK